MLQMQFHYTPKWKTEHLSLCIETGLNNNLVLSALGPFLHWLVAMQLCTFVVELCYMCFL
jgi:hypothetical protein